MQIYRNYSINVIVRVIGILLMSFGVAYFTFLTPYWTVGLWMLLFITLTTINLISYTQKNKREMINFLLAIKQKDFTSTSHSHLKHNDLHHAQREILKVFQHLNQEKEFEHQYLKTIVDHIQVALVCFDADGEIMLFNNSARVLFQLKFVKNISEFKPIDQRLYERVSNIQIGEKEIIKLFSASRLHHLSLQCSAFKLQRKVFKLVSFQDIKAEMEENELLSWQKLIKVMTHEIKNSAIPIATLTDVIYHQFSDKVNATKGPMMLEEELLEDLKTSLHTVSNRSKGLVNFVKAYNSLTKLPSPKFEAVRTNLLLSETAKLMHSKMVTEGVDLSVIDDNDVLEIKCDKKLIEQLLINLIINAADAVKEVKHPIITIQSFKDPIGNVCIQITDNGIGIAPDKIDDVFIPFYTTKPEGSGIGLSLSRQIMRMHKGRIEIINSDKRGTTIQLTF